MDTQTIPAELRARKQWLAWYYDEEGCKIPVGKTDDPATWCFFADLPKSRIAYVISADDPYTGVDFDDCVVNGVVSDEVQAVLERFRGVAYAEISPSGTGVKITTRAKKPVGARCQEGKWLECYDHRRFWTVTGDVLEGFETIGDGQKAINWLCETYLKPVQASSITTTRIGVSTNLEQRALAYIENADRPLEGGRNNSAFRLAGHLAALVDEHGQRLSDDKLKQSLDEWNRMLVNPLSDAEIAKVVKSALKNGTPREDKQPEITATADYIDIDWENFDKTNEFIAQFTPDESELEVGKLPDDPGPFPEDCLLPPGFIGDLAKYTLETSDEPQPILALGGAMCLLSVLTGRKIKNTRDNRTNVFVLGLGPSGCGKDRPRKVNVDVLNAICKPELLGAVSVGSGHGFESQLRQHPAKLFQLDEIGDLLKAIKKERGSGHMEAVLHKIKMLMTSSHQIYTNSATADSKAFFSINQPHLVIFGTATPEKFWSNLNVDAIEDGFMGRILPLEVHGYADTQYPADIPIPEHILAQARAWSEFCPPGGNLNSENPDPIVYLMSDDAKDRHQAYCKDIDGKIPKDGSHKPTDGLWKRARGRAASMALLFAASRQGPLATGTIELIDVSLAIKVTNWITRRTIFKVATQVSENQFQKDCNRVFDILAKRPMDRSALCNRTPWLRRKERQEILEHLVERGDIIVDEVKTKTNTKYVYRPMSRDGAK